MLASSRRAACCTNLLGAKDVYSGIESWIGLIMQRLADRTRREPVYLSLLGLGSGSLAKGVSHPPKAGPEDESGKTMVNPDRQHGTLPLMSRRAFFCSLVAAGVAAKLPLPWNGLAGADSVVMGVDYSTGQDMTAWLIGQWNHERQRYDIVDSVYRRASPYIESWEARLQDAHDALVPTPEAENVFSPEV